jgi:hypothetical protein
VKENDKTTKQNPLTNIQHEATKPQRKGKKKFESPPKKTLNMAF